MTNHSLPDRDMLRFAGTPGSDVGHTRMCTAPDSLRQTADIEHVDRLPTSLDWTPARADDWPQRMAAGHCAWLELWHCDLPRFLQLPDERPQMAATTALWIPDLFMKRLETDGEWTLLSPRQCPDLHELYGAAFDKRYEAYEAMVHAGKLDGERLRAGDLWQHLLASLCMHGAPWPAFKDPCNLASPQRHAGVIHCPDPDGTGLLNTSADESALTCRGMLDLARYVQTDCIDRTRLQQDTALAVRMLDNSLDTLVPASANEARALSRHRPIGLGLSGIEAALAHSAHPATVLEQAIRQLALSALEASMQLACERGACPAFEGSLWHQGILPVDTATVVARERGAQWCDFAIVIPADEWLETLRTRLPATGMRNMTLLAPAPAAGLGLAAQAGAQRWIDQAWPVAIDPVHLDEDRLDDCLRRAWRLGIKTLTLTE